MGIQIYSLRRDSKKSQICVVDNIDLFEKMPDFTPEKLGVPLATKWEAPVTEFVDSHESGVGLPDITQWLWNDLIVSKEALKKLVTLKAFEGIECYPLAGPASEYWILNFTSRVGNEALDLDKCKFSYFEDGSLDRIEKLVLKESALRSLPLLFTLEIDEGAGLYAKEDFLREVEKYDMKGLCFTAVESA